jgi:hypothetical protein
MTWGQFKARAEQDRDFKLPADAEKVIRNCYRCPNLSRQWRTYTQWWICFLCYRENEI